MDNQQLSRELLTLPEKIREANKKYLVALSECESIKFQLVSTKNNLLDKGLVKGANEDLRRAGVWLKTEELEYSLMKIKDESNILKMELDYLKLRLESAIYIVRLLKD